MKLVPLDRAAVPPPFCRIVVDGRDYHPVVDYVAVERHAGGRSEPRPARAPLRLSYLVALAVEGEGKIIHDGRLLPVRAGTLVLSSPMTRRDLAASFPRGVTWMVVLFSYADSEGKRLQVPIRRLFEELAGEELREVGATVEPGAAAASRLGEAFEALQRYWRPHPIPWLLMHRRFLDFLLGVVEEALLPEAHVWAVPPGLMAVKDEIDRRFREYLTLAELARLAALTPNYLCRRFKECFGYPPREYQMIQQLRFARTLLADSTYRVNEISRLAGFPSRHHFSRLFRERTGMSPSAYRLNR